MATFEELLNRLEELIAELEAIDDPARAQVFELLDGIDSLHRVALRRLAELLDEQTLERLRSDPAVGWLLHAYGVGIDEHAAAEAALEAIRLAARTDGLLLDPVYTGKAFAALLDDARRGRLGSGDTAVYVHTGGLPLLFNLADQLGPILGPGR